MSKAKKSHRHQKKHSGKKKKKKQSKKGPSHHSLARPNDYLTKYHRLMDNHLEARAKYYDLFYKVNDKHLKKLEKNFSDTMNNIRKFEQEFPAKFKGMPEIITAKAKLDTTYSQNHNLGVSGDKPPAPDTSFDPHFTSSQKNLSYKEDREESTGTMEDYKKLKGLTE